MTPCTRKHKDDAKVTWEVTLQVLKGFSWAGKELALGDFWDRSARSQYMHVGIRGKEELNQHLGE